MGLDTAGRSITYRGSRFIIEYARLANGTAPGLEFFNSLEARWQARIQVLYQRLGDHGRILNAEMFKKKEGGFCAFKAYQVRLLGYFRQDARVVVTHGFIKKTDKLS